VHPSRLEGGAHVVIEALRSGTAVLASAIDGNTGILGDDHPGLFVPGDDAALAALLERCRDDPSMLPALRAAGDRCAPLFAPQAEAAALQALLAELLPG
jgi:glycosyltransferase involved in cell wall biosynthesis